MEKEIQIINNYEEIIVSLIRNKEKTQLKNFLLSLPLLERNSLFLEMMTELYRGNGWILKTKDEFILLFNEKERDVPFLIVSVDSSGNNISIKQATEKLNDFDSKTKANYFSKEPNLLLQPNYNFISLGGFEEKAYILEEFNLKLETWHYVEELIENYDNKSNRKEHIDLLPHNKVAYRQITKLWKETNKVAVVQATGTGKTYIALKCALDFKAEKILILAPSLPILNHQFKDKMPRSVSKVTYMTYQKAARLTNEEIEGLEYKLIVLDEFHRIGAEKWSVAVNAIINNNPNAKVLGLSATAIRYLDDARDMAEELFDENKASHLTLGEAIVRKILPMPKYVSTLYTVNEEFEILEDKVAKSFNKEEEKLEFLENLDLFRKNWDRSDGVPSILRKYLTPDMKKFIVFTENKEHLIQMKDLVVNWFRVAFPELNIEAYSVWNEKGRSKNEEEINRFSNSEKRNTIHLLFSINMLNEGLHVEDVSGVILLRKTASPTIFYQQIGRAIQAGKNHSPIIFDFVNNFQNIKANQLTRELQYYKKKERKKRKKHHLVENFPEFTVADETSDVKNLLHSIENRLIENWDNYYDELVLYKNQYGDCLVPSDYIVDDKHLGKWVGFQRNNYTSGYMSREKVDKLNELGFVWNVREYLWDESYQELLNYKKDKGDCAVHNDYIAPSGKKLGNWVVLQRTRKDTLSEEQIKKLDEVGFIWSPHEQKWEYMYNLLLEYVGENGHCLVPSTYEIQDSKLGNWVIGQRAQKNNEQLSQHKIQKLEAVGFIWDANQTMWEKMYESLKDFYNRNGHIKIPEDLKINGKGLNTWLGTQRNQFRKDKLTQEKIGLLNQLNALNDDIEQAWTEMFEAAKQYKEINGDFLPKDDYLVNGKKLRTWINKQKQYRREGKISHERNQKLDNIGFWEETVRSFEHFDESWNSMFQLLEEFYRKNGNSFVPATFVINEMKLGSWVKYQRRCYKEGTLSDERIAKLQKVDFAWNPFEQKWFGMYYKLKKFFQEEGHSNVPKDYSDKQLVTWVLTQRQFYKKGTISEERIAKLNQLNFIWDLNEAKWNESYQTLVEYQTMFGHCTPPSDEIFQGKRVGGWVTLQRSRKKILSEARIKMLDEIGFKWEL